MQDDGKRQAVYYSIVSNSSRLFCDKFSKLLHVIKYNSIFIKNNWGDSVFTHVY